MKRLKLTPQLPAKTSGLIRFEQHLEEMNRIYWLVRVVLDDLNARGIPGQHLCELIRSPVVNKKLNISFEVLKTETSRMEAKLRQMMLVDAVSHHEDYLATTLSDFLLTQCEVGILKPVELKASDVPEEGLSKAALFEKAVSTTVDNVLAESYEDRIKRIAKLLRKCGAGDLRKRWGADNDPSGSAPFEVRNCIVHSGGIADERAVKKLKWLMPNCSLGEPLPLDEDLLWRLLAALRDMTRAVDLTIRSKGGPKKAKPVQSTK